MIRLTSAAQAQQLANMLPAVAVERMVALEGDGGYLPEIHGEIRVAEADDSLELLLGELALLDMQEGWSPFEYVVVVQENNGRVFEAVMALGGDASQVLIIPDEEWLHPDLREVLETHAVEEGGDHVGT